MKIGIIGSGISGLTTAYLLQNHHEVTLFEKENWVGGHTHTVQVESDQEATPLMIDTGFIVFNNKTYPNFIKLIKSLDVEKKETSMSFSVSNQYTGLEYNGTNLRGLFAQPRNLFNLTYLKMLKDIIIFNKLLKQQLNSVNDLSLAEFLDKFSISPYLITNYFLPMVCSIWSGSRKQLLQTPARFLIAFLDNHGMLNINDRPNWYIIKGGSSQYVNKILAKANFTVRSKTAISVVTRETKGVRCITDKNQSHLFDHVVIAAHANDALKMMSNPSKDEIDILSSFPYQDNCVLLHTDINVLPSNNKAWASWNFRLDDQEARSCRLSYNMNMLQGIDCANTYCISVNQEDLIDKNKILAEFSYAHPIMTLEGFKNQNKQLALNGKDRLSFCGAYWGYGFHEDGVNSALQVSKAIGGATL